MNDIPCIKNKCLLYPACVNKNEITCTELREYYFEKAARELQSMEVWTVVKETLPKLTFLYPDEI